jgi:signal transduction histidine kinase
MFFRLDIQNYIILSAAIINLFFAFFIFIKNSKKKANLFYSIFTFGSVLWSIGMFFYRGLAEYSLVMWWSRFLYFSSGLIPLGLLFFTFTFPSNKSNLKSWQKFFIFMPAIIIIFSSFIPGFIIKDIVIHREVENEMFFGFGYNIWSIYLLIYFVWSFINLFKIYKTYSSNIIKLQTKYILIGGISSAVLASTTNLILPALGYTSLGWIGQSFTIIMVGFVTYAIAKYRLMDIRLVISKSILYFLLIGSVATAFTSITFFTAELFSTSTAGSQFIITLIVSVIIVMGLDPLKRLLSNITDKIFYRGKINYQEVLRKLSEITAREINLEKLLVDLSDNIEKRLKYKGVDFLYKSNSSGIYRGIIDRHKIITSQEEIIKHIQGEEEIIITEELFVKARDSSQGENKLLLSLANYLQKRNIGLIAPIISEKNIIGFLTIEKKKSDDVFSAQDINLISVLIPQIANALEKAKLYNEVQEFNVKLQEKVDKATQDLKNANLDLETRNQYLTALQKVSSTISRSMDLSEVIQFIANSIQTELKFKGGVVNFINEEEKFIYIGAMTKNEEINQAIKSLPNSPFKYKVPLSEKNNLAVKSILGGEIQKSNLLYDLFKPAINEKIATLIQRGLGIKSAISVPIYSENNIIGSIDFFADKESKDIKAIDIEVMKSLADQTGLVIGNLKLYQQIREKNVALKQANVHLKKLDEAKSEFLSIASHQLRTPLTGIKGYLSMILEGDYGKIPEKQEKIIQDVFNASDRMSRLINVFLNVSRIESGRLKLDYTDVDLRILIEECIKDLKSSAQEKGLKLSFDYKKGEVPNIKADSDKMKDVILNLIDNAIKYTPKGKIDIKLLKQDDQNILVQIKDTGIGLNQAGIEKLFNKFSRGEGISKINTGGSGLGLYIVRRIIEEHGGKVLVESDGPGKGSTFQFTLPIKTNS